MNGDTKSCGCLHKEKSINRIIKYNKSKKLKLKGQKFGRLFVLKEDNLDKIKDSMWECKCSCGNKVTVSGGNLKNGGTRSCGCLNTEKCIERNIQMCGMFSPLWKGGISKEPYCFDWTKDLKEYIKQRDDYKCVNSCCNSKNPDDLTVHHIDYNKKSCDLKNLITLCRSCNTKANFDREWHKNWYQAIMYRRYEVNV